MVPSMSQMIYGKEAAFPISASFTAGLPSLPAGNQTIPSEFPARYLSVFSLMVRTPAGLKSIFT